MLCEECKHGMERNNMIQSSVSASEASISSVSSLLSRMLGPEQDPLLPRRLSPTITEINPLITIRNGENKCHICRNRYREIIKIFKN